MDRTSSVLARNVTGNSSILDETLFRVSADKFKHCTIEELGLFPVRRMTALGNDYEFVVRHMARDHSHNRRRSEHIGAAGHKQRPDFQRLELRRRYDIHQVLSGASKLESLKV